MEERVIVRRGAYHDSVTLMQVSRRAAGHDGAEAVAVAMATPLNLELIADQGFDVEDGAGPNDLVIAVRARDPDAVLAAVEAALAERGDGGAEVTEAPPRSLRSAVRRRPGLSVACLSIPGPHVPYEAAAALEAGLHVFCFSDGVSLAHEAALKRRALERGLLFLGADCGTAIIDGVALGFANIVDRGPVGIVGASGTGIQQVCCLLDAAGVGISHAIGVGGRDLQAEIGGAMTLRALELLAGDPDTEAIVVISKPPDPEVARAVQEAAPERAVVFAETLEAAAARAAELVRAQPPRCDERLAGARVAGTVQGLFCGGTLCEEARGIVGAGEFTDFGADELTEGRAHPMIDPSLRLARLRDAADDQAVAVLLLDVVLGYGAHPDPAPELAAVLEQRRAGQHAIVSLCGTARDPQGLDDQRARLEAAGAVVTRSNAHAARLAREAAGG
jgi:FdrA protein